MTLKYAKMQDRHAQIIDKNVIFMSADINMSSSLLQRLCICTRICLHVNLNMQNGGEGLSGRSKGGLKMGLSLNLTHRAFKPGP